MDEPNPPSDPQRFGAVAWRARGPSDGRATGAPNNRTHGTHMYRNTRRSHARAIGRREVRHIATRCPEPFSSISPSMPVPHAANIFAPAKIFACRAIAPLAMARVPGRRRRSPSIDARRQCPTEASGTTIGAVDTMQMRDVQHSASTPTLGAFGAPRPGRCSFDSIVIPHLTPWNRSPVRCTP